MASPLRCMCFVTRAATRPLSRLRLSNEVRLALRLPYSTASSDETQSDIKVNTDGESIQQDTQTGMFYEARASLTLHTDINTSLENKFNGSIGSQVLEDESIHEAVESSPYNDGQNQRENAVTEDDTGTKSQELERTLTGDLTETQNTDSAASHGNPDPMQFITIGNEQLEINLKATSDPVLAEMVNTAPREEVILEEADKTRSTEEMVNTAPREEVVLEEADKTRSTEEMVNTAPRVEVVLEEGDKTWSNVEMVNTAPREEVILEEADKTWSTEEIVNTAPREEVVIEETDKTRSTEEMVNTAPREEVVLEEADKTLSTEEMVNTAPREEVVVEEADKTRSTEEMVNTAPREEVVLEKADKTWSTEEMNKLDPSPEKTVQTVDSVAEDTKNKIVAAAEQLPSSKKEENHFSGDITRASNAVEEKKHTNNSRIALREQRQQGKEGTSSALRFRKPTAGGIVSSPRIIFEEFVQKNIKTANRSLLFMLPEKRLYEQTLSDCAAYGELNKAFLIDQNGEKRASLLVEFRQLASVNNIVEQLHRSHKILACPTPVISCSEVNSESHQKESTKEKENMQQISFPVYKTGHQLEDGQKPSNLNHLMKDFAKRTKMSEKDRALRFFVLSYLSKSITRTYPMAQLLPFGSSVNGLGSGSGDLDISVVSRYNNADMVMSNSTLWKPSYKNELSLNSLVKIVSTLPDFGIEGVIPNAKVPIIQVKFKPPLKWQSLKCDLSTGNSGGLKMSEWLYNLTQMDYRVAVVALVIKRWAQLHLTNIVQQTFIVQLMMIFFMQNQKIIPTLEQLLEGDINTDECDFRHLLWKERVQWPDVSVEVDEILREFFAFFKVFNFRKHGMFLLDGSVKESPSYARGMYIENPFESKKGNLHNASRNVHQFNIARIIERLSRASFEIGQERKMLQQLKMAAEYLNIIPDVPVSVSVSERFTAYSPLPEDRHSLYEGRYNQHTFRRPTHFRNDNEFDRGGHYLNESRERSISDPDGYYLNQSRDRSDRDHDGHDLNKTRGRNDRDRHRKSQDRNRTLGTRKSYKKI